MNKPLIIKHCIDYQKEGGDVLTVKGTGELSYIVTFNGKFLVITL